MEAIEQVVADQVFQLSQQICQRWLSDNKSSRIFDLASRIQFLTVDTISQLSLGEAFGCVINDIDRYQFLSSIKSGIRASLQMSVLHELIAALYNITRIPFFYKLLVPSPKDLHGLGQTLGVSYRMQKLSRYKYINMKIQVIRRAIEGRAVDMSSLEKRDMLGILLEKGLTLEQMQEELLISLYVKPRYAR